MQISFVNWKGGCGKSTVALSVLECLKKAGKEVDYVEHDLQKMVTKASKLGGRYVPVSWQDAKAKYILHDLPPYPSDTLLSVLTVSEKILVPTKVSDNDKLCTVDLIEFLKEKKLLDKAVIVFNEIRKPYTNIYRDVKKSLEKNFSDVKIAQCELSDLRGQGGFKTILRMPLSGKAFEQALALTKEVGILIDI